VGLTAWQVLIERANLKQGQKVLIHAGSVESGTFAIQTGKAHRRDGATTTSTGMSIGQTSRPDVRHRLQEQDFEKSWAATTSS